MNGNFYSIVIPANSSNRQVVGGKYYTTVTTTDLFYLRANNGPEVQQNAGREYGDGTFEFSALTFYNRTGTDVSVTFYAGAVPYKADPSVIATIASLTVNVASTITHKATTTLGSGIVALVDGVTSAAITNTNGKQFLVRNHATSTGALQILDASGTIMDVLQPGDPAWTLETSGTFKLKASGGDVNYSWGKVIYT